MSLRLTRGSGIGAIGAMLVECATITQVELGHLTVESARVQSCDLCASGRGCGGGVIAKLAPRKTAVLRVPFADAALCRVGQRVQLGLSEHAVLVLAAFVYLIPLIGLAFGALISDALSASSATSVVGAFVGLLIAVGTMRVGSSRLRQRYLSPVIEVQMDQGQQE